MRKQLSLLTILGTGLALSGCALFGGGGSGGTKLDEFRVARNAPLVIPPDYSLTPPRPGTASLTAEGAQTQAVQALFGGPAPRSSSETGLLEKAGADRAALGARSVAGSPDTAVVDKGALTQTILSAPAGDGQTASVQTP
ncbi:hypothetical protein GGQ97_000152 [Sphingomonas kaistensis]|uniref:DUF3035 domain-containing protein n=1 Tax=Sphingomonas kaistensis TaxID=298708 RepID=A0A7X6BEJ9_9SPHN|nr:DUF3035 domain-containing protein [Sphingomonas kaistensis]NJC04359.1 hypothetical protein [Sphingomonas kaistensis]